MKQLKQRYKAMAILTEYIMGTSQKNVCDFLNSGKLYTDENEDFLWLEENLK